MEDSYDVIENDDPEGEESHDDDNDIVSNKDEEEEEEEGEEELDKDINEEEEKEDVKEINRSKESNEEGEDNKSKEGTEDNKSKESNDIMESKEDKIINEDKVINGVKVINEDIEDIEINDIKENKEGKEKEITIKNEDHSNEKKDIKNKLLSTSGNLTKFRNQPETQVINEDEREDNIDIPSEDIQYNQELKNQTTTNSIQKEHIEQEKENPKQNEIELFHFPSKKTLNNSKGFEYQKYNTNSQFSPTLKPQKSGSKKFNITKKDTIEDMSMNIELNNQNVFINMDHFDEASKIGFGMGEDDNIFDLDSPTRRLKNTANKLTYLKTQDKETNEEEIKRKINMVLHHDNTVLLYSEIQNFKTFKKFMKDKINHYLPDKDKLSVLNPNYTNDNISLVSHDTKISKRIYKRENKNDKIKRDIIKSDKKINDDIERKSYNVDKKNNFRTFNAIKDKGNERGEVKVNIKRIEKENNELKDKISELEDKISQLEKDIEKKNKEIDKKNDKLNKYLDVYDKVQQEKEGLQVKMENILDELNLEKNENTKKTEKISELQSKIAGLELSLNEAKSKIEFESSSNKENKQNYDLAKTNYTEIKNQYELLNIKYQSLSDENFNYKRDILLYEKEIKNKNEMIQKLRNNLIESNRRSLNEGELKSEISQEQKNPKTFKTIAEKVHERREEKEKEEKELEKKILTRAEQIKLIEFNLSKLNKERGNLENELNKIPEHPKKREQINKRKEIEKQIEQISFELSKLRIQLKTLKQEEENN